MAKKKQSINPGVKIGLFFGKKDFDLEVQMGRSYIESDIPAVIWLHRVNHAKMQTHSLYGETYASEKVTLPPVELSIKFNIEDNPTGYLGNSTIGKQWIGDLTFTIYELELEEKKCDIHRGDFVSLINSHGQNSYFEVYDSDSVNLSNLKTLGGIESYYRKIKCKGVDKDVFIS